MAGPAVARFEPFPDPGLFPDGQKKKKKKKNLSIFHFSGRYPCRTTLTQLECEIPLPSMEPSHDVPSRCIVAVQSTPGTGNLEPDILVLALHKVPCPVMIGYENDEVYLEGLDIRWETA